MTWRKFPFAFEPSYRRAALLFGVIPPRALAILSDTELNVRFGPWRVRTPIENIAEVAVTGPYRFAKTAGPARLSFADRGLTLATNGRQGVCISFVEPIAGAEPTGRLRHPNLTLTVADCYGLADSLDFARRRAARAAAPLHHAG
jgi:hypothetical protein